MRNFRGTYVHRGDAERRRRRIKRTLLAFGFVLSVGLLMGNRAPEEAKADDSAESSVPFYLRGEARRLQAELDETRGSLELAKAQLDRTNKVFHYSSQYRIGADLAATILDVALAEGIEPELAFRLVRVESQFNERAVSRVGAVGLTQLMLPTARYFEKGVTREKLFDRETNLRIGFRYLRALIRQHRGNVPLALLVYNRGPVAVQASQDQGVSPSNGYEHAVMKGYRGSGVVE